MLTQEQNERLTRVGPGTPGGEFLRRYWHPIAAAGELDYEPAKQVTILGETLVLYRDRQGRLGLIGERCPHQGIPMVCSIVEPEGLRCAYHGWMFDHTGACIDLGEDALTPDPSFKDEVRIAAYPVEELGGLVFAYLGPEPRPLLPCWEPFITPGVWRSIASFVAPCNWVQCMENQLGDRHTEWMHARFGQYARLRRGQLSEMPPLSDYVGQSAAADFCEYERFEFGLRKRRVHRDDVGEDGVPIVLPNLEVHDQIQYFVPFDDTHTWSVTYRRHRIPEGAGEQKRVPVYELPLPGIDERGHPTWDGLDTNMGQDRFVLYARGAIVDRTKEHLGTGSKGIVMFRDLLEENFQRVERGEDPMGVIRDPSINRPLRISAETDDGKKRLARPDPSDPVQAELRAMAGAR
jgi:5,5'-dehydrodivanillate O-demethylase